MNDCLLVALIGRPNVGKSSLFNRLARQNKAIIDPTPGVTRDRHYARVTWAEKTFLLVDTGGIDLDKVAKAEIDHERRMSALIREQSWQAVRDADILVLILDGRQGLNRDDYELIKLLRKTDKPLFYVINKIDNPAAEAEFLAPFYELGADTLWPVSAAHGLGINDFMAELVTRLPEADTEEAVDEQEIALAVIGRPNVGKSSLINRLAGEERMVVSNIPGTTRDSIDTVLEKRGVKYRFIDTAGIRRKGKVYGKVEKFSVMRALKAMERAAMVLVLVDAGEGITEQDTKVIGYAMERGRACLVLVNKWDLIDNDPKRQKWLLAEIERVTNFIGYAPTLRISALNGLGTGKIFPVINEVYKQFCMTFSTGPLNRILRAAVEGHSPALHRGRRLKLYYTTQVSTKPPTFVVYANYPKAVHFSYFRYLVNQYRTGLGLDKTSLKIILRERKRRQMEGGRNFQGG
ncbi:MAG TPA: ribosome biogenesis GTPase Der [Desulfobacterales bacterium]|nr:ribosome biogenesis GTPase Der [Desulfobacterales bacterium]